MGLIALFCLAQPRQAKAQCSSIDFVVNDSLACLNQVLTFRASNVPALSTYFWYLGADTITGSNKDTVSTGYRSSGSYSVSLKIKLNNGDSCRIDKASYITVKERPASPTIGLSKSNLCNINDTTTLWNNTPDVSLWTWNIGQILYEDTGSTITHRFIRTGYFPVSLTVEDSHGCQNTARFDSLILVERPPQVKLGIGDTSACDTLTLNMNPKVNLYGQSNFSWDWRFSGANVSGSSKRNPGYIRFNKRGKHSPELYLFSQAGCKFEYSFPDTISIGEKIQFDLTKTKTSPCNEQTFTITVDNSTAFRNDLIWEFQGDSLALRYDNQGATASYKQQGSYAFKISHDDLGCISTYQGVNAVNLNALKARFSLDHDCHCTVPDTLRPIDNSIGTGPSVTYVWEVLDDRGQVVSSATGARPDLVINKYGDYSVKLRLDDTSSCFDTIVKYLVYKLSPPDIAVKASPQVACAGSPVLFSLDSTCLYRFKSADWAFYDSSGTLLGTESGKNPSFSFNSPGTYDVGVRYTNYDGCTDTVFKQDVVTVVNLQEIDFSLSDTIPCAGGIVNASLKLKPANITPSVRWTFQHISNSSLNADAKPLVGQPNEFLVKIDNIGIYDMKIVVNGGQQCKDSLELSRFVKVSGINAGLTAASTVGCLPFKTSLNAIVSKNAHYENPSDNTVEYSWIVNPADNVTLGSPDKGATSIEITEIGNYDVIVQVKNSDGCVASSLEQDLFSFDFEAKFSIDSASCVDQFLRPTNNTAGANTKFRWKVFSGGAVFYSDTTKREPQFSFTQPGKHQLRLIATMPGGCNDTAIKTLSISPFNMDFSVVDPKPRCTPAQFVFEIDRVNVDTFSWSFGDGQGVVTDQDAIAHVYDLGKVQPFTNWFDVNLIGFNNVGCRDTIGYDSLIRVLGPDPTFYIANPKGCEPHEVVFLDSTQEVTKFYFNYGDGSSVDSVDFSEHTYIKKDSTRSKEIFRPYIIASDKNNCFVTYQPEDTVTVYAQPIARFSLPKNHGCAPFTTRLINRSKHAVRCFWDFENDGVIDDTTRNPEVTFQPGTYSIKLIVENEIGCFDTLLRSTYLRVTERPYASFRISDTILCPGVDVQFTNRSTGRHRLATYKWYFNADTSVVSDSSSAVNPTYGYSDAGLYSVKMVATDLFGCTDTSIREDIIRIYDNLPLDTPTIHYVTVENNRGVFLSWEGIEKKGFYEQRIIKNQDYNNPFRVLADPEINSISLTDGDVANESVQYEVQLVDRCKNGGRISLPHASIYLNVSRDNKPYARLNWTPYNAWDTVGRYAIYRAKVGGDFKEIARIQHPDSNYVDVEVCNQQYFYQITTVHPTEEHIVQSNTFFFDPKYERPADTIELHLVTVDRNNIHLNWGGETKLNVNSYFVDRYDTLSGWVSNYHETQDTFFVDKGVEINTLSYKYRIWYTDFCNNASVSGNVGKSILLEAQSNREDFIFTWNGYRHWKEGVLSYVLEKTNDTTNVFEEVKVMDSTARRFVDEKKAIRSDSSFFVRVKAISAAIPPDTSYSNIIKVAPEPLIFIPNAFSPNGDGVNEEFKPDGIAFLRDSTDEFILEIYNRWGQRVFRTNRFQDTWDGTFNGGKCQEGVYIYHLQLRGVNRVYYSYRGSFVLIR